MIASERKLERNGGRDGLVTLCGQYIVQESVVHGFGMVLSNTRELVKLLSMLSA